MADDLVLEAESEPREIRNTKEQINVPMPRLQFSDAFSKSAMEPGRGVCNSVTQVFLHHCHPEVDSGYPLSGLWRFLQPEHYSEMTYKQQLW